MYLKRLLSIAALVVVVSGCGLFPEKDKHAYRNAKSIKPIEMPPGMEMSNRNVSLLIPEQTSDKPGSVDELELPPQIDKGVSLDVLDDKKSTDSDGQKEATGSDEQKAAQKIVALVITATKDTNGDSFLLVDNDFDTTWPLVKPALIELGFKIDDASRGNELYAISKELPTLRLSDEPIHPGDVEPEVKEEYQIHVKPSGEQTKITVHNKLGQLEGSGLADHLLLQIKEIMENPKKPSSGNS